MSSAALLTWGFVVMVPRTPGGYVLLLTVGTFGLGILCGHPSSSLTAHPWRRHRRLRRVAAVFQTRRLAQQLTRLRWNAAVRRPIRRRADLQPFRRDAVGALLSHTVSMGFHVVAAMGLAGVGHPWWSVATIALGAVVHGWPALLQVDVLSRLDEVHVSILAKCAQDDCEQSSAPDDGYTSDTR